MLTRYDIVLNETEGPSISSVLGKEPAKTEDTASLEALFK